MVIVSIIWTVSLIITITRVIKGGIPLFFDVVVYT